MKRILLFILVLWAMTSGAYAVDYSDLAPYINDRTILLIRIDALKLDPAAITDKLSEKPAGEVANPPDEFRQQSLAVGRQMTEMKKAFTDAGGREIYLFMAMAPNELRMVSMIVIPLEGKADGKGIINAMKMAQLENLEIKGRVVVGRPREEMKADDAKAVDRPDIKAAIEELSDTPLGMAFVPSAEARKVFVELEPRFPEVLGGGATADLLNPLTYVAGKLTDPVKLEITLLLKSSNKPATEAIAKSLESIREGLLKTPELKEMYPLFMLFKPEVKDDRVLMRMDSTIPRLLLTMENQKANESFKMTEAMQLAALCEMWANEHKREYPTLDELEAYAKKNQIPWNARTKWVYLKPQGNPTGDRIVVHEPANPWPGRVVAGFADGHADVFADQKKFEELLAKYKGK